MHDGVQGLEPERATQEDWLTAVGRFVLDHVQPALTIVPESKDP